MAVTQFNQTVYMYYERSDDQQLGKIWDVTKQKARYMCRDYYMT